MKRFALLPKHVNTSHKTLKKLRWFHLSRPRSTFHPYHYAPCTVHNVGMTVKQRGVLDLSVP